MLRSSNDMTGGQTSTIKVEKTPLGLFRASVENTNLSHIKPVEDKHEQMAVRMLTDRIQESFRSGEGQ